MLFFATFTAIVSIAYVEGLFKEFLSAAASIISCAFDILFGDLFLGWVSRTRDAIAHHITDPYRAFVNRIPRGFKAMFFTLVGYSIFVFDHVYNTKILAEDETTFYDIVLYGHKYWITDYAVIFGGAILSYGLLYFFVLISEIVLKVFDKRIKVSVVLRK